MNTAPTELDARLRAWAKGSYPLEAGVELLIRNGKAIYEGAPWINDTGERAWIDVDQLLDECGAWSGGEQRIVRLAASLIGEEKVNLNDELSGNDRGTTALLLAAVAHASGSHEGSDVRYDAEGAPYFVRPGTLYAWPEE